MLQVYPFVFVQTTAAATQKTRKIIPILRIFTQQPPLFAKAKPSNVWNFPLKQPKKKI